MEGHAAVNGAGKPIAGSTPAPGAGVNSRMGAPTYRIWMVSEARRKLKVKAVEYKGGKCEECGYNKSHAALDFHHTDPTSKDLQISNGNYRQWDVVRVELDKCRLLCSNCHREEHERLRSERVTQQARTAREEVPERVKFIFVRCLRKACQRDIRVVPSRLKAESGKLFCSVECASLSHGRTIWPSDTVLARVVWQQPVLTLSKMLGVSGGAVKKRCRIRGIATPPRGYWSSLRR